VLAVVRGGMHSDTAVRQSLEMIEPRIKILKMHGGTSSSVVMVSRICA